MSTTIDVEHLPCAERGLALGEPLGGTAPTERGVLVIEQPGPWGRDAVSESGLRPIAGDLEAAAATAGLKLLVVRAGTRRYDVSHSRNAWVAGFEPGRRFLEHLAITDPRDLLGLPLSTTAPTGAGVTTDEPLLLACTHSTRDACCARLGLPLARALMDTGTPTWHCSHLGGHRFAPTMAVLPHGLWLGRVAAPLAAGVVADVRAGRIPLPHLRGRAGVSPMAQVAEIAVREQTGIDGLDDVAITGADGGTVTLTDVQGGRWSATVTKEPTGTVRAVSCGPDAKREDPGVLRVSLARDDAGAGPRLDP